MGLLFGKGTRGVMMGVWNTHQYAGNIVGLSVASAYSDEAGPAGDVPNI